jgi:hypothetical protein
MTQPLDLTGARLVLTGTGELTGDDTPANRELARRIRACINACDGIATEELERGLIRELCQVLTQVAPLLRESRAA